MTTRNRLRSTIRMLWRVPSLLTSAAVIGLLIVPLARLVHAEISDPGPHSRN